MQDLNFPDPMPDFDSEANVGTWRQLFADNMGRRVKIDISLFNGVLQSITGDLYIVGNSYVGVTCGDKIYLTDIYAIKFVTFC